MNYALLFVLVAIYSCYCFMQQAQILLLFQHEARIRYENIIQSFLARRRRIARRYRRKRLPKFPVQVATEAPVDQKVCCAIKPVRMETDPTVEFYRIQWGPEYCSYNQTRPMEKTTTQESFTSLRGLLFSCKYKVLLQPVSKKSRPLAESTSFLTPSCATIQAKSPKPIACPGETAVSTQKVLVRAANLTASFEVRGGNVTAIFSWDLSMTPPHQQLTGYQVTWAEVIPTNHHSNNKLPHSLISQSQILPPDGKVLVVSGLHPASLYRLEVQVITAEGEGPATSRTFQTPGYHSAPKHRSRLRKHHYKQSVSERH